MRFEAIPLSEAKGRILGHNVAGEDGRRALRKGKPLTAADITRLAALGREKVYVAQLEAGDVDEDTAARRIATAVSGDNLRLSKALTGRANIYAAALGILRVDQERLLQLNLLDAVTLATLPNHSVVAEGKMVATLKIIAYGIPAADVREAELIGCELGVHSHPLLRVDPLRPQRVGLILSGSETARENIVGSFERALRPRLALWGSELAAVDFVPLEDEGGEAELAALIRQQAAAGVGMIILAGETAIMDRYDIAPRAVERAGGRVTCFGAPVDPGNLLMLGRYPHAGREIPIVGAPGCARSPKRNIVDLVIPRLLAGDHLTKMDIVMLGHGGLLDDVPERPLPRTKSENA